ncbi:UNVERIFIED_CONTAM: ABC-type Fe3+-hydroxamate transport system substrate-binding protein [Brevibacillus sp. OAP136]
MVFESIVFSEIENESVREAMRAHGFFLRLRGIGRWIFGDNAGRGGQAVYNALQIKMPSVNNTKNQTLQLSMETLPQYAADYMFLTTYDPKK